MLKKCVLHADQGEYSEALSIAVRCLKCLNCEIQMKELERPNKREKLGVKFWMVVYITHYNLACILEIMNKLKEALIHFEKAQKVLINELNSHLPFDSI